MVDYSIIFSMPVLFFLLYKTGLSKTDPQTCFKVNKCQISHGAQQKEIGKK